MMQIADLEIEELGNNKYIGIYEGDTYECLAPNFATARLRIIRHFKIKSYKNVI